VIELLPELPLLRIESTRLTTTRWFYGLRWAFPYAGGAVAGFYGVTATSVALPGIPGLPLVPQIFRSTFAAFIAVVFIALVIGGPLLGVVQVHREIRSKRMELIRTTPAIPIWIVVQWALVTTLVPVIVGLACLPGLVVTGAWGGLSLETILWLFGLVIVSLAFASSVAVLFALHVPSIPAAMVLTFLALVLTGIAVPTAWFALGGTFLDVARFHPFCAMIAAYRHPDLFGGPNGPWPPVIITLAATGLVLIGAAFPGLPSVDGVARPRKSLLRRANPFDPLVWEGTALYEQAFRPWSGTIVAAARNVLPRSMTTKAVVPLLLGIPLFFPDHAAPGVASACLTAEMVLLIVVAVSAGTLALAKEPTRPTLPLILAAPLETYEVLSGCSRGLLLALTPYVCLPVAHAFLFAMAGTLSGWAPYIVFAIALCTAFLFVQLGLFSAAVTQNLQGGMALGILLGLGAVGILPFLSPLVASLAVLTLGIWTIWRLSRRAFGSLEAPVDERSLGIGCVVFVLLLLLMRFLLRLTTAASLRGQGIFEDIWWANPVALTSFVPVYLSNGSFPSAAFLRVLLLCCFSCLAAAWGLSIILRVKFDAWTDRVP
jgi:hypothetical protein